MIYKEWTEMWGRCLQKFLALFPDSSTKSQIAKICKASEKAEGVVDSEAIRLHVSKLLGEDIHPAVMDKFCMLAPALIPGFNKNENSLEQVKRFLGLKSGSEDQEAAHCLLSEIRRE